MFGRLPPVDAVDNCRLLGDDAPECAADGERLVAADTFAVLIQLDGRRRGPAFGAERVGEADHRGTGDGGIEETKGQGDEAGESSGETRRSKAARIDDAVEVASLGFLHGTSGRLAAHRQRILDDRGIIPLDLLLGLLQKLNGAGERIVERGIAFLDAQGEGQVVHAL
jgi:hypothetical protein